MCGVTAAAKLVELFTFNIIPEIARLDICVFSSNVLFRFSEY